MILEAQEVLKLPDYCHGINVTDSGRIDHITYRVVCNQGQIRAKLEVVSRSPQRGGGPQERGTRATGTGPNGRYAQRNGTAEQVSAPAKFESHPQG